MAVTLKLPTGNPPHTGPIIITADPTGTFSSNGRAAFILKYADGTTLQAVSYDPANDTPTALRAAGAASGACFTVRHKLKGGAYGELASGHISQGLGLKG